VEFEEKAREEIKELGSKIKDLDKLLKEHKIKLDGLQKYLGIKKTKKNAKIQSNT